VRRLALAPIAVTVALAATGWLYLLRADSLPGPRVRESLPLDELAKHASVPLVWFGAVWAVAAFLIAAAARWARLERLTASFGLAIGSFAIVDATSALSIAVTRQVSVRDALHVAARLEAVYLPAALVGLLVAAAVPSQERGQRSRVIVSTLVAVAGGLDLLHRVLPGEGGSLLHNFTPDAVGPLARAAGAFSGLALLFAARGLARGRRRAWEVAVAVAALSTGLHVLHGLAPGTLVSAFVLILLVARRHDFSLPGDTGTRYLIATRTILAVATISVYGIAALWVNRLDADQSFTLRFAVREISSALLGIHVAGSPHLNGAFGQWFPLSLFLLGLGATAWIVGGWLAPWRHRVQQEARERLQARALVHTWGADTLSPFTLRSDKSYFFAEDEQAFLSYRVVGAVAIVSGDPIGPPESIETLLTSFVAFARRCDWRIAILGASERCLPLYAAHGLQALYHGDEAVVDVTDFSLDGRRIRKVRQSVQRLERCGYRASVLRPGEIDPELRSMLEAIAADWRGGQPERGFAMALDALFVLGDDEAVFVIGRDENGEPKGFLHFALAQAGAALSLSSMPRLRQTTPNGFNEWLICETIAWAREHGYGRVSLNFSPFAALLAPEAELSSQQALQRRALLALKGHFQLDNLLAFNRKFFPAWERRFIVFERRLDLPRVSLAALAAEAYLPFQTSRR
jgi:lysyl-tRNA synthetase class 2